jgi:integrase
MVKRVLFIAERRMAMAIERRKDNKNRVLKEGEYQRSNGTFEYKWRDKTGKRHSIYSRTLNELREKEKSLLRDSLDGLRTEKKDITLNDLYERWTQIKRGLKANTFQNYKYMYTQFVKPNFGNVHLTDLRKSDVRAFYNSLVDDKHIKANSIESIHTVLHQVLELAVEDEYIRYNPSDNALKELKKSHNDGEGKRSALTVKEQELFESFLVNDKRYNRWQPIFTVMLWTGMRVGETTGLCWEDVNFEDNTISVNHTLVYFNRGGSEKCGYAINTPKTKAGERTIPMLPVVRDALTQEKQYQNEFDIKPTATIDGYSDFVFVNRFGGVYNQGSLNKALKRIIRDCNYDQLDKSPDAVLLPNFSNHSLRHTFTTRMCEAGVNIKVMQDILGHADAETTLQIYTDATKEFKQSEMNSFKNFFENL